MVRPEHQLFQGDFPINVQDAGLLKVEQGKGLVGVMIAASFTSSHMVRKKRKPGSPCSMKKDTLPE